MKRGLFGILFLAAIPFANAGVWDVTTPLGSEAKSLGDDRIREMKVAIQEALQEGGVFPGSDPSTSPRFYPSIATGTTALRPTGNDAPSGRLYINLSSGTIEMSQGNGTWNALDVVGSSSIASAELSVDVAGAGLDGGGGIPLRVNVDSNTFTITNDTVTIKADSIGTSQLSNSVSFPTSVNSSSYTLSSFGILPIIQIQQGTVATSSNTNQASFINSLLTVTITPKLSTSKILVVANGPAETGAGSTGYMTLLRGSTNLGNSNGLHTMSASTNHNVTLMYYDSPATTSATTYTAAMRTDGGGSIFFPVSAGTPTSVICAIEVAQ